RAVASRRINLAERATERRGHVALVGPSASERQIANHASRIGEQAERTDADPRGEAVHRRMRSEPAPRLQADTLVPGPEVPLELLFAELPLQVGQRNLDGTYDTALVAHRRCVRQIERVLEADVHRCQDRADRSRIDPSVRMPSDV